MILIISSDHIPHIGGKSTHIMSLMDGIKRNGEEAYLFTQSQYPRIILTTIKLLLSPVMFYDRTLFQHLYNKIWRGILCKRTLKLYNKLHPSCISCQDACAAASLKKIRSKVDCPIILTMHTYFGIENGLDNKFDDLKKRLYTYNLNYELESLEVADKIIAVDDRIKKHVQDTIASLSKKVQVRTRSCVSIENFTNVDIFTPGTEADKEKAREKLGIKANAFVIICARRLVEKNGVIYAVEAMKKASDEAILLIAGDGPQREAIEKRISELGLEAKVRLLGSVSSAEIVGLYKAADCSLVPSVTVNGLQEATSISALEAMSCGLPTIASRIGGLIQIISDGENGYLIDERDPVQISEAIDRLRDETVRREMSRNARNYVVDNHSHVVGARDYLNQFKETLS